MLFFECLKIQKCVSKMTVIGLICIILQNVQIVLNQEVVLETTPAAEMKRLREDLLKNYDTNVRPVKDRRNVTRVLIYFDVRHIIALDEKYQSLTVEGILMMKWTDEHLRWDPFSYSGITLVRFKPKDIWVPDIHSLFNVKKSDLYDKEDTLLVQVSDDGSMKWYPPTIFDVPCSATYKHYPFDSHNCSITFGAWTHSGDDIHLETFDIPISSKSYAIGTEWTLTNSTHENVLLNEHEGYKFYMVKVGLYLKRTSTIYRYVCVVPTLIVIVTSMCGFWLLPSDGSRYLIGCSNVILMSLILQHLAKTVPAGREIPLLAQYNATCLCMSGAFLVITVITQLLRNCSGTPPNLIVRLAYQYMDQYLCLFLFSEPITDKPMSEITSSTHATGAVSPEEEKRQKDWMVVSLVVDRIAFWIFVITYAILLGVLASL